MTWLIGHENLTIREAVREDAPQLLRWWQDPELMAEAGLPAQPSTLESVEVEIEAWSASDDVLCVVEYEGRTIGECRVCYHEDRATAIPSWTLCDPSYQNHGIGTQVIRLMLEAIFADTQITAIQWQAPAVNARARHIYEKKFGLAPSQVIPGTAPASETRVYRIDRADFEHIKLRLIPQSQLITEFYTLGIPDLPEIRKLNVLEGSYINAAFPLPNGAPTKFLDDDKVYLGDQLDVAGSERSFGLIANEDFIMVCDFGPEDSRPELVAYRRRSPEVMMGPNEEVQDAYYYRES